MLFVLINSTGMKDQIEQIFDVQEGATCLLHNAKSIFPFGKRVLPNQGFSGFLPLTSQRNEEDEIPLANSNSNSNSDSY